MKISSECKHRSCTCVQDNLCVAGCVDLIRCLSAEVGAYRWQLAAVAADTGTEIASSSNAAGRKRGGGGGGG